MSMIDYSKAEELLAEEFPGYTFGDPIIQQTEETVGDGFASLDGDTVIEVVFPLIDDSDPDSDSGSDSGSGSDRTPSAPPAKGGDAPGARPGTGTGNANNAPMGPKTGEESNQYLLLASLAALVMVFAVAGLARTKREEV
jgi:LPXTG-motif cell wall-anchored protein